MTEETSIFWLWKSVKCALLMMLNLILPDDSWKSQDCLIFAKLCNTLQSWRHSEADLRTWGHPCFKDMPYESIWWIDMNNHVAHGNSFWSISMNVFVWKQGTAKSDGLSSFPPWTHAYVFISSISIGKRQNHINWIRKNGRNHHFPW